MNNKDLTADVLQARAALWELLAFSLRYPTKELIEVVSSGEWQAAAREITDALDISLPDDFAADLSEIDFHVLRAEATRLFVGSPDAVVSPYEGVWAASDDGVKSLLFVNPKSMEVERFCSSCGLGQPEGTNEPLDYVATECELMQFLSQLEAGLAEPLNRELSVEDLPGSSAHAAYEQFMTNHVQTWMPRFADSLKDTTTQPFYVATAQLLRAMLAS